MVITKMEMGRLKIKTTHSLLQTNLINNYSLTINDRSQVLNQIQ
ncbi:MAG: hypothetical protein ACI8ZM_004305 [Crocinitomix sp.]|jgi:hypothetical protein